ncbi:MAG: hypothetical protein AAGK32_06315 [Actinomycetota bacterium]
MELHLFEHTGELVRAMLGEIDPPPRYRAHRRGVKVWFGPAKPTRFHYEAQLIPGHLVDAPTADGEATIEVGFHAEHGDDRRNRAVLDHLGGNRRAWHRTLGDQAELGPFLGNSNWGRLSEVWVGDDLDDPELAFELASRLVDYVEAVEPLLDDVVE